MSVQRPSTLSETTVRELSEARDEPDWLLEMRLKGLNALDEANLPDVIETPGRRWTNLSELDFEKFIDAQSQSEQTVRKGPEDVEVKSFQDALEEHEELLKEYFGSVIDPAENYFTALSAALFTTGTFVYVPEGTTADEITIRGEMESPSLFSQTLVVAEESASATILESITAANDSDSQYFSNIVEVVGKQNSYVQYGSLQTLPEDTYNYTLKRGTVQRDAMVNWIEGNIGSRLTRSDVETKLVGDGSETKIVGTFFGRDDQHLDVNARVWHEAAHTTADLVTRGVLDDKARSVYEGVQDVGRDAWDTSSYQRENTLMLSDDAEADASPKLIIHNHDTEASHSATVGQVDEEELLYLTSRGIDKQQAIDMLVEGFFVPVLEEIDIDEFRADIESEIMARLQS